MLSHIICQQNVIQCSRSFFSSGIFTGFFLASRSDSRCQ